MTKLKPSILILTLLLSLQYVSAQDTLTLLTGKSVAIKLDSITDNLVYFQLIKKNKMKAKVLDKESVFSIMHKDGTETVIYRRDPDNGYDFSEQDMRYYIYGAQDANKGYKNPWATMFGLAIGGSLGYALNEEFYVAAIPFVVPLLAGVTGVSYNKGSVRDPEFRKSEAYQSGYFKAARSRKIFNALVGSVVGTGAGLVLGSELK